MLNRRSFAKLVGGAACSVAQSGDRPAGIASGRYRSPSPFDVGTKTQLLIDRVLVRESREVAFTLHPAEKHPANPLVLADKPWEGWRLVRAAGNAELQR